MLPTLRHGDKNVYVEVAQILTDYEPPGEEFSAYFVGHLTNWQSRHGCTPDGVIGPKTWTAIAGNAPTVSDKALRKGKYARAVQLLVGADPDGIFGRKTEDAVKVFQSEHGLKADGVVGEKTWRALITGEASPAAEFVQPPNFKQYDSRWAKVQYSSCGDKSQTIKSSGCGPTSMADIVAQWWDDEATPPLLAKMALDWGCRTKNSGTSGAFFKKCAAHYKARDYKTSSSIDSVRKCLDEGGYAVVCFGAGTKGKPGYQKWTKGGHYCVIWGYDGSTYFINDPASSAASRAKGTRDEILATRKGFYLFWK